MTGWRMEEILEGLVHGETGSNLARPGTPYLATESLDPERMNDPVDLEDSLRASFGQELAQTVRARLLGSAYGRYYLVDGSQDGFRRWNGVEEDQLEELVHTCREEGLAPLPAAARPPSGLAGTVWACRLAEMIWPTDQGKLRLGLALQAMKKGHSALHWFDMVAAESAVPSSQVLALLLATNLELHEQQRMAATIRARRAIQLAPNSAGVAVTSLLAGIQAHDIPLIREASFRLDELGSRASMTLDVFTEQRARRVRDGLQEEPRQLPRSTRAYFGDNALRVYNLS